MSKLGTWASRVAGGRGRRSGGTVFSSQAALTNYLREHPKADASKHSVAQSTSPSQAQSQSQSPERRGTAPLPATGSAEHRSRDATAKDAQSRGAAGEKKANAAAQAGKPGLAAVNFARAAVSHLDVHPAHGSFDAQLGKAEKAMSNSIKMLDRVSDPASRERIASEIRQATRILDVARGFKSMTPEQREAKVQTTRRESSLMR